MKKKKKNGNKRKEKKNGNKRKEKKNANFEKELTKLGYHSNFNGGANATMILKCSHDR